MKKTSKKWLIIGVFLLILVVLLLFIIINIASQEKKENFETDKNKEEFNETVLSIEENKKDIPESLLEERTIKDIKIKDIEMLSVAGTTTFKAKAENISKETLNNKNLKIIFKDYAGEETERIEFFIETLNEGETIEIDFCLTKDISMIKEFDVLLEDKEI